MTAQQALGVGMVGRVFKVSKTSGGIPVRLGDGYRRGANPTTLAAVSAHFQLLPAGIQLFHQSLLLVDQAASFPQNEVVGIG